jgi:dTDP-4-dehydrorhamnose reductase
MNVLVVGGDGLIGGRLAEALTAAGHDVASTSRRAGASWPLDLEVDPETWQLPEADAVVICAAIARLAQCEDDPDGAARINVGAPAALARHYGSAGCQVLFLSSDKVFDGLKAGMPRDAVRAPRTRYGVQKARAEEAVLSAGARCGVLRLTKVLAPEIGLVQGWAGDLRVGKPITPFSNMYLAPASVGYVTALIVDILAAGVGGIYQASGAIDVPYTDLGLAVAEAVGAEPALVRPVSASDDFLPPDHRPPHSTLEMERELALFGRRPPLPGDAISEVCLNI